MYVYNTYEGLSLHIDIKLEKGKKKNEYLCIYVYIFSIVALQV